jgi:hypothetical protein
MFAFVTSDKITPTLRGRRQRACADNGWSADGCAASQPTVPTDYKWFININNDVLLSLLIYQFRNKNLGS